MDHRPAGIEARRQRQLRIGDIEQAHLAAGTRRLAGEHAEIGTIELAPEIAEQALCLGRVGTVDQRAHEDRLPRPVAELPQRTRDPHQQIGIEAAAGLAAYRDRLRRKQHQRRAQLFGGKLTIEVIRMGRCCRIGIARILRLAGGLGGAPGPIVAAGTG